MSGVVVLLVSTDGDVYLAENSFVTRQTTATESVFTVLARGTVLARIRLTFVDIDLAVVAFR